MTRLPSGETLLWAVRTFVYERFATTARAPSIGDIAQNFDLTLEQAGQRLRALHDQHALFLEPGALAIRMANPFSAVPTAFEVEVNHKTYQANCAWDSFGVVAALGAGEANIRSVCAHSGAALSVSVRQGQAVSAGEVIHFLVPFRQWYRDIIFT